MEIQKTKQAVSVSKAEEDQRVDVTKAKPIGQSQTPDSFEIGSSRASSKAENGPAPASTEPEKKAGQITGGILIKQMTAARLGESGIKSPESRQSKENDGKKDLRTDEQNAAGRPDLQQLAEDENKSPLEGANQGGIRIPDGTFSGDARSNRELVSGELKDFLADHGFDPSSGGGGTPRGDAPPESANAINDAFGGQTGPGDMMDSVNEKFDRMKNLGSNANSLISGMRDQINPESGDAPTGPGKDMISDDGGKNPYSGTTANELHGVENYFDDKYREYVKDPINANKYADEMDKKAAEVQARSSAIKHHNEKAEAALSPWNTDISNLGSKDSQAEKAKADKLKKEQAKQVPRGSAGAAGTAGTAGTSGTAGTAGTSSTSGTSGSSSTSGTAGTGGDVPPEEYRSKKGEKVRQFAQQFAEMFGVTTTVTNPKIQGDVDPDPDAPPVSNDLGIIAQMGAYGLLGQPIDREDRMGGGLSTSGIDDRGGVTDPEDGSAWHGAERTEDPGDFLGGPELKPAATDATEDDDDDEKTTNTGTKTTR